ncbi:MAG: hypothetical protein ACTSWY_08420, partial [Promethearchaeota archaeon]
HAQYIIDNFRRCFTEKLIKWGKINFRNYPWRKKRNPYRVLVGEIFLQRTKAAQVVPVYEAFLKKYPDVAHLIGIKNDQNGRSEILSVIESLGLAKRTNVLTELFTAIKKKYGGKVPDTYGDLLKLKGIGAYIASATLCFGFNRKKAILDSNVARIYERLFNIHPETKTAKSDKFLWNFCEQMLPEKEYIDFNYAILDFGGIICLPRIGKAKGNCSKCVFADDCYYFNKKIK